MGKVPVTVGVKVGVTVLVKVLVGRVPVDVAVGVKVIVGVLARVGVLVTVGDFVGVKTTTKVGVGVGVGGTTLGADWAFRKPGASRKISKNFFKLASFSIQFVNYRGAHLSTGNRFLTVLGDVRRAQTLIENLFHGVFNGIRFFLQMEAVFEHHADGKNHG